MAILSHLTSLPHAHPSDIIIVVALLAALGLMVRLFGEEQD